MEKGFFGSKLQTCEGVFQAFNLKKSPKCRKIVDFDHPDLGPMS
jgi:hypothetical protein